MVGKLIAQHTSKIDQTKVYDAPLFRLKTLVHLLTREITHANMFMKTLDAMGSR